MQVVDGARALPITTGEGLDLVAMINTVATRTHCLPGKIDVSEMITGPLDLPPHVEGKATAQEIAVLPGMIADEAGQGRRVGTAAPRPAEPPAPSCRYHSERLKMCLMFRFLCLTKGSRAISFVGWKRLSNEQASASMFSS